MVAGTYLHAVCLLLLSVGCISGKNYITNPGFEDGLNGWKDHHKSCEVVTDDVHSGSYALHCIDNKTSERSGVTQIASGIPPGFLYNISGWFKLKDVGDDVELYTYAQSLDKRSIAYSYSSVNSGCKSGTCMDKWYHFSGTSKMFFGESVNWTISSILSRNAAVGEFWLDDLVLEPLRTPFLGYIETTAWKQEVFEDEIEIYVNMLINETAYDGGKQLCIVN